MEWNLSSIAHVLVGGSIAVAGIILATIILGVTVTNAPLLLLITIVLVIMGIIVIVVESRKDENPSSADKS
ncbi:MAG: hypothetical protein ABFC24_05785 [Methanoregulaceae archaeon]